MPASGPPTGAPASLVGAPAVPLVPFDDEEPAGAVVHALGLEEHGDGSFEAPHANAKAGTSTPTAHRLHRAKVAISTASPTPGVLARRSSRGLASHRYRTFRLSRRRATWMKDEPPRKQRPNGR